MARSGQAERDPVAQPMVEPGADHSASGHGLAVADADRPAVRRRVRARRDRAAVPESGQSYLSGHPGRRSGAGMVRSAVHPAIGRLFFEKAHART
jgi:hypothetical protein